MIVTLQTQRVRTLEQARRVAEGNEAVDFTVADRALAYEFIRRTLVQFDSTALGKADKGAVKAYLAKMTGLSRAQLTRLMAQHRCTGRILDRRGGGPQRPFVQRYTAADMRLLGLRARPALRAGHPGGGAATTGSSPTSASRAWRGCRTGICTTCAKLKHLPASRMTPKP